MVKPFQFARLPEIRFKCGIITDLPLLAGSYGNRIALVTGMRSFMNSGHATVLFDAFKKNSINYHVVKVPGEPSPQLIDNAVKELSEEDIKLVIGIGGGSVLDAGKAISAMMYRSESVSEFLEEVGNKTHPGTKIPYIAIPTTSGTGSEATKNAVISQVGVNGFKRSLRHNNFVPDIALIDPVLTLQCPEDITAASGMDCFTQLTEAYLSDKSNAYTDVLALEGLRALKQSLVRSYTNGDDIIARTGMSFASLTSGICLANAGLGVVHGFASSVGGMYNIPHGLVCGTLMAAANEVTVRELRKNANNLSILNKYAILGKLFLEEENKADDYYIDGFIKYLHLITGELKLPGLRSYGLEKADIEMVCKKTENKNNPVKLAPENLEEILLSRLN